MMPVKTITNEQGHRIVVGADVLDNGAVKIEVVGPHSTSENFLTRAEAETVLLVLDFALNPGRPAATEVAKTTVCEDILRIMETYDEQMNKNGCVDTPGGLEHMGDVWRLLDGWRRALSAPKPEPD